MLSQHVGIDGATWRDGDISGRERQKARPCPAGASAVAQEEAHMKRRSLLLQSLTSSTRLLSPP